jgi:uncharacterized protein YraI
MKSKSVTNAPPAARLKRAAILLFIFVLVSLLIVPASAQPSIIIAGTGLVGQINDTSPLSLFVFSGLEGELISVKLFGLTAGFTPTLAFLNASQQTVGTAVGSDGALTLATILPSDGNYSLLIGSLNGQPGEFAIRVDSNITGQPFPLVAGEQLRAEVPAGGNPQILTFDAGSAGFLMQLGDPSGMDTAGKLRFSAQIVSANDGLLAEYHGIYGALTAIPGDAGRIYAVVGAASPEDTGSLDIVLLSPGAASTSVSGDDTSGSTSSSSSDTPGPVQTPEVTGPSTTTSGTGGCVVTAGPNGVNIRGGDGTNFAPVGQIEPNGQRPATGRNANASWYAIDVNGTTGWVSAQVVTLSGECGNLPVVAVGSQPSQPTTSGSNPTATNTTQQTGPTATPSATLAGQQPTEPATPTATPSPTGTSAPVAPPDNQTHRFDVHRDNGGTFSEVVSYPDGDITDRIEMRVDLGQVGGESTRNVTITLNCNGSGTQNLYMTLTSPNAQRYGCGQSITTRYSAPFGTGYYYVFMDGGPGYVNYTLVASTQP